MPLTIATLAFFTAVIVVLRLRWPRLGRNLKRRLTFAGLVPVVVLLFAFVTDLSTTSEHLNAAVYWGFVLGYIFFIMLFTLLRPVWLTSLVAIILLVPLLSASAIFPMAAIFSRESHHIQFIGTGLVSDLVAVNAITPGASGADLNIYHRFSWAPFLRRRVQGARYFHTQCDAGSAYAILQPDHDHVRMICPANPDSPQQSHVDLIVKLH